VLAYRGGWFTAWNMLDTATYFLQVNNQDLAHASSAYTAFISAGLAAASSRKPGWHCSCG
jgi:hypothetical protein